MHVCVCVLLVALNRAKSLLDRATEQANSSAMYFERLTDIQRLIVDINNHTDHAMIESRHATTSNERNRRLLRTILVRCVSLHPLDIQSAVGIKLWCVCVCDVMCDSCVLLWYVDYRPHSRGDNMFGSVRVCVHLFFCRHSPVWTVDLDFGMKVDLDLG